MCGARGPWRGAESVGGVPGGAEGPPEWPGEGLDPLEMRAGANGWAIEGTQSGYAVLTRPRSGRYVSRTEVARSAAEVRRECPLLGRQ